MSTTQLLVLGALAGFTIFLGLPIGRIKSASTRLKAGLSAMATGILLFLLWDVLVHGIEPVEAALTSATDEGGSWLDFVQLAVTFAAGATIGMMSLVYYDRWFGRQRSKAMLGPGAASAAEFERSWVAGLSPAAWLALLIATGIGLHNFSEGLAIGQSAAQDQVTLALVLIIGFGLHNATEGFGIVAPLSGSETRPTWKFLVPAGADRRRSDLRRDAARPRLGERDRVGRLPRARGRLDPLRRDPADERQPEARVQDARRLDAARGAVPRLRDRLHHRSRRSLISLP